MVTRSGQVFVQDRRDRARWPPRGQRDRSRLLSWARGRQGSPVPAAAAQPVPALATVRLWADAGDERIAALPGQRLIPVWSQPVHAHLGGAGANWTDASWWWLGAHGGAGVTTLRQWIGGGADAHRWWPDPAFGGPGIVVLVCRTHAAGLARARDAVRQWAVRQVPEGLMLAGVVAIADAPGRLPRPQADAVRLLSGVVPQVWQVPWVEELRAMTAPAGSALPPALGQLAADLGALRPPRPGPSTATAAAHPVGA